MDKVHLVENRIMITRLPDDTMSRFDFRGEDGNYTLYVQLGFGDNYSTQEIYYTDTLKGDLSNINEQLGLYDIKAVLLDGDREGVYITR